MKYLADCLVTYNMTNISIKKNPKTIRVNIQLDIIIAVKTTTIVNMYYCFLVYFVYSRGVLKAAAGMAGRPGW